MTILCIYTLKADSFVIEKNFSCFPEWFLDNCSHTIFVETTKNDCSCLVEIPLANQIIDKVTFTSSKIHRVSKHAFLDFNQLFKVSFTIFIHRICIAHVKLNDNGFCLDCH